MKDYIKKYVYLLGGIGSGLIGGHFNSVIVCVSIYLIYIGIIASRS